MPLWALRGRPGHRGFPDKPDNVRIIGWKPGDPDPSNKKRHPNYKGPHITFTIVEQKSANDLYLVDARNGKCSIYVPLVRALMAEGWAVELCTDITDTSSWSATRASGTPRCLPLAPMWTQR